MITEIYFLMLFVDGIEIHKNLLVLNRQFGFNIKCGLLKLVKQAFHTYLAKTILKSNAHVNIETN